MLPIRAVLASFAATLLLVVAESASAASAPASPIEGSVTLQPVAAPIVADGRLQNYVFVIVKVLLQPGADPSVMRAKEPYFRDALVRAAHRTPFVLRYDYDRVDEARLKAVMMREALAIAGPRAVRAVVVVEQTPEHRVPSPRPPQQAAR